jgi:hypothetical protein
MFRKNITIAFVSQFNQECFVSTASVQLLGGEVAKEGLVASW